MKISELKEGITNVEIEGRVVQLGEVRQVSTRYGPRQVADNIIEDDSGQVKLTLWGEDIEKVKIGDTVKISGGYVKAWNGELQLATGRNGSMTIESGVAGEGEEVEAAAPEAEAAEPDAEAGSESESAEAESTEAESAPSEPEPKSSEPAPAESEDIEEVKIK